MKIKLPRPSRLLAALACATALTASAQNFDTSTRAINGLGLDLLAKATRPDANTLLSPYSIQSALAMTWAGADGDTRAEMARVLHYPANEAAVHQSFVALQKQLAQVAEESVKRAKEAKRWGGPREAITLTTANRLFGQKGYAFRDPFLGLLQDTYGAPFEPMDFLKDAAGATKRINRWVEAETRERIRGLVPPGALDSATRLVLVNAIYLKAPWAEEFSAHSTAPRPFRVLGKTEEKVPTMLRHAHFGFAQRDGYRAVTVPYSGGELQLLVVIPDDPAGLAAVEAKLTPEQLAGLAGATAQDVILFLPKFKLEPPLFALGKALRELGMKTAFDEPKGSANFERMAPRKPGEYLCISEVFHKTFIALDEKGTEAAAATAVVMMVGSAVMREPPKPIEVKVDRPFLFAIQHRASGACLFLGRVTDPR